MEKEDIYNGITDIRADLVEEAGKRRRKSRPWRAAVAACLAVSLVAGGAWAVLAGRGKSGGAFEPSPGIGGDVNGEPAGSTGSFGEDPSDDPPASEPSPGGAAPGLSGTVGTQYGWLSQGLALTSVNYPQAVPYPADGADTAPWREYQRAHQVDPTDAGAMWKYLSAAVPAFLGGTGDTNHVCSPVNLFGALAMLTETAAGETRAQLLELLGLSTAEELRALTNRVQSALYNDDGAETVLLSSSLWLREDLDYNRDTLELLASDYFAAAYAGTPGTEEMDCALRDWLNERTGGFLEDSAGEISLDPTAAAVIATTVCFSARWERGFSQELNGLRLFHAPSGDVEREFMNGTFTQKYYPCDGFTGVELSFRLGGSMRFLLPKDGVSPEELLRDPDALDFLMSPSLAGREGTQAEIRLSVPKFDVTCDTDLVSALRDLGVTDAFEPETADLSGLTDEPNGEVWISRVLHSARVRVDEDGCEAAAFAYIEAPRKPSQEPETIDLILDRPFLFSVMEEGLPLFTGVVNEP